METVVYISERIFTVSLFVAEIYHLKHGAWFAV